MRRREIPDFGGFQVAAKYREMIESMGIDEKSGMDKMQDIRKYIKLSHKKA